MSKPLFQKLGMKPYSEWCLLGRPDHYFEILGETEDVKFSEEVHDQCDGIHFFAYHRTDLEECIVELGRSIKRNGMIWISWYKKSSPHATDMNEDIIREVCLPMGLVDNKVCRVDDDWSALKLVWRKELR